MNNVQPVGLKERIVRIQHLTKRFIGGIMLLVMDLLFIWCVVGSLSAYGIHEKLKSNAKQSQQPILKILNSADDFYRLKKRYRYIEDQYIYAKSIEDQYAQEITRLRSSFSVLQAELERTERSILAAMMQKESTLEVAFDDQPGRLEQSISEYLKNPDQFPELQETGQHYIEVATQLEENQNTINVKTVAMGWQKDKKDELQAELITVKTQLEGIADQKGLTDIIHELYYLRYLFFHLFSSMPNEHLTFLLTLCMGALGSLIYISKDYLIGKHKRNFSWFVFRPILGMVTAVAIYILAKAGQITISEAGMTADGSGNLNPYFISFLAIISGLLSEQAIERIRETGRSIFKIGNGDLDESQRSRWLVHAQPIIEAQGKKIEDLSVYVSASLEQIKKWMSGQQAVPPAVQAVIASWLNARPGDIFTDISPKPAPQT